MGIWGCKKKRQEKEKGSRGKKKERKKGEGAESASKRMKGGEEIRKGGIREREERKLMQIRQGGKSKDQELKCEDGEKHKA